MKISLIIVLAAIMLTGCATVDTVRIDSAGATHLNGKPMPITSLSDSFTRDKIRIVAEQSSPHSAVIAVMNEAKQADINNISFKTKK